ncbi:hypothetical protein [Legionella hackeliae]|uniref:Uncharacterized protein n=1 Tax=Legionella hackeliae TaxID=449 RepID=A0A0A8UR66_LEGHA|nr:hypothetical protein [Legionella hackeliae]KTD10503.1 hypothetical protein Lhac_2871 [Legionella hackeliae]CEK10006.1 protein of unknown function [Legionella hackeliae]STX49923.1 Uncharacterised protein [Legionella hackeliae]
MGRDHEIIQFRLEQIQNLVHELQTMPVFSLLVEDLQSRISSFTAKLSALSPEFLQTTPEELTNLELLLFKETIKILREAVSQQSIAEDLKLKLSVLENNAQPLSDLTQYVRQFKALTTKETSSTNMQQTTSASNNPSKTKRKNKHPIIIDDSFPPPPASLQEKINDYLVGLKRFEKTFTLPLMDNTHQQDYVLHPLLGLFKEKTDFSQRVLSETQKRVRNCIHEVGYHEILVKELKNATHNLETNYQELTNLHANIWARYTKLTFTTMDTTELTENLVNAQLTLLNTIETFLKSLSAISATNRTNTEWQYCKVNLVMFIEAIYRELKSKNLPINQDAVEEFRIKCLQHLGEKTGFFNFIVTTKPLEEDVIQRLLKDLFTGQFSKDRATLENQFAVMQHFISKIETFPIHIIKDYVSLTDSIEKQSTTIHDNQRRILEEITLDLLPKLQRSLDLFFLFSPSAVDKKAKETRKNLQSLEKELTKFLKQFDEKETHQLAMMNSLKEKFLSIPKNEKLDWDSLQQIVGLLHEINAGVKNDFEKFDQLATRFKDLKNSTLKDIRSLNEAYNAQKETIGLELKEALIDTQTALEIQYEYEEFDQDAINTKIADQLNSPQAFLLSLQQSSLPLESLLLSKNNFLLQLSDIITRSKIVFKEKLSKHLTTITQEFHSPLSTPLTDNNPFKASVQEKEKDASDAFQKLTALYHALDATRGKDLKDWVKRLEDIFNVVQEQIKQRNQTRDKALEIERRLQSPAYQTSITALETLSEEFLRILKEYTPAALTQHPDNPELQQVYASITHDNFDIHNDWQKGTLDKIDSRLFVLLSMHREFEQLNNQYINKNLFCSDATYLDELTKKVEMHLDNSHMETLSNAKRSALIQWIRTHILRSLQAISHRVINYLKPSETTRHRFFVTLGACQTEHTLVKAGNEVYEVLKSLTPVTA